MLTAKRAGECGVMRREELMKELRIMKKLKWLIILFALFIGFNLTKNNIVLMQNESEEPKEISQEQAIKLFSTRCVPCHGANGRGRRIVAYKAPDFNDVSWQYTKDDKELEDAIKNGIGAGRGAMPRWKNLLDDQEIKALVKYIRTFAGKSNTGVPESEIIELYASYCNSCHGNKGDLPSKKYNNIPDFNDVKWQFSRVDEELFFYIKNGVDNEERKDCKWPVRFIDDEAKGLISYIRTFPVKNNK
jgi:cbb3-type cytochrome c oxidase subunit III